MNNNLIKINTKTGNILNVLLSKYNYSFIFYFLSVICFLIHRMKISQAIIKEELEIFEDKFRDSVRSNVLLLDRIMSFIVKRKGKQLRPMFVLLTAKLCGTINESTYRAASLVELLHTATLVHDDVVDESMERRGFFSTYALWKA